MTIKMVLTVLGTLCILISLIQLHPNVRKRFRERGFSDGTFIPSLMASLGIVLIVLVWVRGDFKITRLPQEISSVYWSDGDSGKIIYDNGDSIPFRLNGVDAPETGGVGASIGGAACELERELGFASKEWIVNYSKGSKLKTTKEYGLDKYDRLVVDLSASEKDIGRSGIQRDI